MYLNKPHVQNYGNSMNILIVDDDFALRKLLNRYLRDYGLCDAAVNGREAMLAFEHAHEEGEPYDLITLDVMMPEMDGISVLKEIRRREQEMNIVGLDGVKIVMISVLDQSEDILSAFREGCEGYITKPFDYLKLVDTLKKLDITPDPNIQLI